MCDCSTRMREALLSDFKAAQPTGTDHRIDLQGYGFAIQGNQLVLRPFMNFKAGAEFPLKKGGTKWKEKTGVLGFSYCPFCGAAISQEGRETN